MARDPAFLFYDGDAARDVAHMNRLQRGAYFDIMQAQLKFGHLPGNLIQRILGNDYEHVWEIVKIVLTQDNRSCFYIEWVDESIKKRSFYSESRTKNANKRWKNKKLKSKRICNARALHKDMHTGYENDAQENENEIENEIENDFEKIWNKYPKKVGKKAAFRHYKASVKTKLDRENIQKALDNYIQSDRVLRGFIQDGSTWFNNWPDWIELKEVDLEKEKERERQEKIDKMERENRERLKKQEGLQ